jgi:Uncharacterised ACR, YkgG family COG1556.
MDVFKWQAETLGQRAVEALKQNFFDAMYIETVPEAVVEVIKFINPGCTVGFGGSQTTKNMGLAEAITAAGGVILNHNDPDLSPEQRIEVMRQQQVCDVFISSSNAVTLDGVLCNVDGHGNRISAMIFGPRKVVIIAGTNKICKDEAAAWERVKAIAAPLNMKRLNRPNPCTKTGECMDCNLPTRGCNAYLTLRKKPSLTDFSVIIIGEDLGY